MSFALSADHGEYIVQKIAITAENAENIFLSSRLLGLKE